MSDKPNTPAPAIGPVIHMAAQAAIYNVRSKYFHLQKLIDKLADGYNDPALCNWSLICDLEMITKDLHAIIQQLDDRGMVVDI